LGVRRSLRLGGETDGKWNYDWSTYKYELGTDSRGPFSKYVTKSIYGTVDYKTVLDPEDDAAHVKWGGSWRMPVDAEWEELINNCRWTWTSDYNGTDIAGWIVTSYNAGYTDKTLFFPAAGCRIGSGLDHVGSYGDYWSSSLDPDYSGFAWGIGFDSGYVGRYGRYRDNGFSVRPVTE